MKLESRRERAERLKKQRRSTLTGMIIAIIVVVALGVVLWRGKEIAKNKFGLIYPDELVFKPNNK